VWLGLLCSQQHVAILMQNLWKTAKNVSHGQQTKLVPWLAVELIVEPTMPNPWWVCGVTYVGGKDMSHFTVHTETLVAESPGGCTLTINVRGLVWWIPTYCLRK
jgi:hypothetical protein